MIGTGRAVTAFSPKKTKTGKTMFNAQDYDKNNPQAKRYLTVFCQNDVEIQDRDKVLIDYISGVGLGEYQGKQTTAIFANVSLVNQEPKFDTGSVNAVFDDSLPF